MAPSYTVQEIINLCFPNGVSLHGNGLLRIEGVSDLRSATPSHLSFFANSRYLNDMKSSKAGAIILGKECVPQLQISDSQSYIVHDNPTEAFQKVLNLFRGSEKPRFTGFEGIHPTAVIHPTAKVDPTATIGPYAVIDEMVVIGEKAVILSHASIGLGSILGKECVIHSHAVIREGSLLGDRVIIQPGAIIGSCGFGYSTDKRGVHTKLEHWGNVVLENDVEIGANTTIDRGRFDKTKISFGTKIDNLVQIAHNVSIGRNCFIVSQVGIAGSTTIGNHVVLAGKVAVNGHIEITDQVMVAACSAVSKSIQMPGKYHGVEKLSDYNKNAVYLRKIGTLFKDLSDRLKKLESMI